MLQVILGDIVFISDFQKPCASKTAGLRVKDNLDLYAIQFIKQSTKPLGFLFSLRQ